MRISGVVGAVAVVGVAVLVGIALTDDSTPETITADTSPFVFAASTSPGPSSTAATTPPPTAAAVATTVAPVATTTTAAPTPPTTAAPTTALIPPEQRAGIAVRVLNGGAPALAATRMSEALRTAGFDPGGSDDANRLVAATRVLYAPGRELDAATVNDLVGARPENVVPAPPDDPNWAAFGEDLAVLVVLGPPGT